MIMYCVHFSDEKSVLDAGTKGALLGIQLVLGITATLIAFTSFVAFMNGVLNWLGKLVGVQQLDLEVRIKILINQAFKSAIAAHVS